MADPRPIGYFDESVVQHEFRQKFGGCVVQLIHPELKLEYWYIESNNDGTSVSFINAEGTAFNIKGGVVPDNVEIVVQFPEPGWYYCSKYNCPMLVSRQPAKQYRRAPNENNMIFKAFVNGKLKVLGFSTDFFNDTLNKTQDLGKDIKILGRKYLLMLCSKNPHWSIVYKRDAQIGMYYHPEETLYVYNSWNRVPRLYFPKVVYGRFFDLKG